MNTESIEKFLKILNFTTTYAILMKLSFGISWSVSHRVYKGVNKKNSQNEPKNQFFGPI